MWLASASLLEFPALVKVVVWKDEDFKIRPKFKSLRRVGPRQLSLEPQFACPVSLGHY